MRAPCAVCSSSWWRTSWSRSRRWTSSTRSLCSLQQLLVANFVVTRLAVDFLCVLLVQFSAALGGFFLVTRSVVDFLYTLSVQFAALMVAPSLSSLGLLASQLTAVAMACAIASGTPNARTWPHCGGRRCRWPIRLAGGSAGLIHPCLFHCSSRLVMSLLPTYMLYILFLQDDSDMLQYLLLRSLRSQLHVLFLVHLLGVG